MRRLVINYNVNVCLPLPMEIPMEIQIAAIELCTDFIRRYCEEKFDLENVPVTSLENIPGIMSEKECVIKMEHITPLASIENRELLYKNAKRCLKYLIKKEKTPYYALQNRMLKMGFNKNHISAAFTHHRRLLSEYRKDEKML